jgi:hypothetical protein
VHEVREQADIIMRHRRCPSDLTDAQWALVAPSMHRAKDSNMGASGFVCYATTCGNDFVNGLFGRMVQGWRMARTSIAAYARRRGVALGSARHQIDRGVIR